MIHLPLGLPFLLHAAPFEDSWEAMSLLYNLHQLPSSCPWIMCKPAIVKLPVLSWLFSPGTTLLNTAYIFQKFLDPIIFSTSPYAHTTSSLPSKSSASVLISLAPSFVQLSPVNMCWTNSPFSWPWWHQVWLGHMRVVCCNYNRLKVELCPMPSSRFVPWFLFFHTDFETASCFQPQSYLLVWTVLAWIPCKLAAYSINLFPFIISGMYTFSFYHWYRG